MLTEKRLPQPSPSNPQDLKLPDLDFLKTAAFEEVIKIKRSERLVSNFVFRKSMLYPLLREAASGYRVIALGGNPFFDFKSQYYDTDQYALYLDHHNERLNRWKIRRIDNLTEGKIRFEIRYFNNKHKTQRWYVETDNRNNALSKPEKRLLKKHTPYRPKLINPSLCANYRRFTLLGSDNTTRVTFDTDLQFIHRGMAIQLPQLAVAEVKQAEFSPRGVIYDILKNHQIYPKNFSKYCIGLAMLNKQVKTNNFKTTLNFINSLNNEYGINAAIR